MDASIKSVTWPIHCHIYSDHYNMHSGTTNQEQSAMDLRQQDLSYSRLDRRRKCAKLDSVITEV